MIGSETPSQREVIAMVAPTKTPDKPITEVAKNIIDNYLASINKEDAEIEIAFFGGSFTAIKEEKQEELLQVAYEYVKSGEVESIRISTRPDYIDKNILKRLKKYKVKCCGVVGAYPKIEENIQNIKNANNVKIPLFYMQGGIDYTKLNKIFKKLLQAIGKAMKESNENIDKEVIEMFEKGKSFVCEENAKEIIEYIKNS